MVSCGWMTHPTVQDAGETSAPAKPAEGADLLEGQADPPREGRGQPQPWEEDGLRSWGIMLVQLSALPSGSEHWKHLKRCIGGSATQWTPFLRGASAAVPFLGDAGQGNALAATETRRHSVRVTWSVRRESVIPVTCPE